MAFVCRSERFQPTSQAYSIGPGAYISQNEYNAGSSYAPFSSTAERSAFVSDLNKMTPGPGSYLSVEPRGPSTSDFDHWGQAKNSSSFASQIERFSKDPSSNSVPGPGSYVHEDHWQKSKIASRVEPSLTISKISNSRSIPSIPSQAHALGYEETEQGELVINKNSLLSHSGKKGDCVGPGQYTIHSDQRTLGTSWHKSKSQRNFYRSSTATGPQVGPGAYTKFKVKVEPMYKFKESSAFACKSQRDQMVESKSPGPGSYEAGKSSFNKKKLPGSLQNFGSSSSRFVFQPSEMKVGPGHYNPESSTSVQLNPKAPFSSSNSRFSYKNNTNPAPGAYSSEDFIDLVNKKNLHLQGAFGSSEKRFDYKKKATPGPGHYRPDNKPRKKEKNLNAVFASKVKRHDFNEKEGNPPPGIYEVQSAFEYKKPPPAGIHSIASKNTRSPLDSQVAFKSSTERFENDEKNKAPGPGSYDYNLKKDEKKIMIFMENRFKDKTKKLPGPTDYFEEGQDNWNRKSFNVLFSDSGVN
jgi:hypothetical protein